MANGGVEAFVAGGDHHLFALFVEREAVLNFVEHLLSHLPLTEKIDGGFFGPNAIRLDEIENQRLLVVIVGVKETEIRLEAVQHTVAIIEYAIELVFRRLPPRCSLRVNLRSLFFCDML